jgi:hypothetical protein
MAEFEIKAGAKLDLLNKAEMREVLVGWYAEIGRGIKFRQFSGQGTVAGAVWTIGGNAADNRRDPLGPEAGMLWAVTRLAVSGNGVIPGTDLFSVFVNEITPSKLVESGLTRGAKYDVGVLVLTGNDRLALAGAGTGVAGTDVTVSGAAIEVPVQLAWQLL